MSKPRTLTSAENFLEQREITEYVKRLPLPLTAEKEVELSKIRVAGVAAEILQGLVSPEDRAEVYAYLRSGYEVKYLVNTDQAESVEEKYEQAKNKRRAHQDTARWLRLAREALRQSTDAEVAESQRNPTPTAEELPLLVQDGENALKTFWESNLRLALSEASRFKGKGAPLVELIQVANLTLRPIIDRFDYARGYKFSTYAVPRLRGELKLYLIRARHSVHVSGDLLAKIQEIQRIRTELLHDGHDDPSPELLADLTGIDLEKVKEILYKESLLAPASINKRVSAEGSAAEQGEFIVSQAPTPEERLISWDVTGLMDPLDQRTRQVITLYLGLINGDRHTFQEIASILKLSRVRIQQLYHEGMDKLRQKFTDKAE